MTVPAQEPGADPILAELRGATAERYRSGQYPADMEADLGSHFDAVSSRRSHRQVRLDLLLASLDAASRFDAAEMSCEELARRVRAHARALRELLAELVDALGAESAGELGARVDLLLEQMARRGSVTPPR
jgi:hypothetical protein